MLHTTTPAIPTGNARVQVAARAIVAPNSVTNYLAGRPMRSTVRQRIEAALRELGFEAAIRPAEAPASPSPLPQALEPLPKAV